MTRRDYPFSLLRGHEVAISRNAGRDFSFPGPGAAFFVPPAEWRFVDGRRTIGNGAHALEARDIFSGTTGADSGTERVAPSFVQYAQEK
jgi:hypothetical protein